MQSENVEIQRTPLLYEELRARCSQFAEELDQFVGKRFRYKARCVRGPSFTNTLDINRAAISLYLRFLPLAAWPTDSIVIAKIGFGKTRRGHGRALLRFLTEVSTRYGIDSVGLEQTHSGESIQGFVRAFGFSAYKDAQNWLVSIDTLKDKLAERGAGRQRGQERP